MDVLKISEKEKASVTNTILNKLSSRGIVASEKCESDSTRAHIDQIVKELKTEAKHHALINRAQNAGEGVEQVDYALRHLILNICAQQENRQKQIDKTTKMQSSALQYDCAQNTHPAPFLSEPAATITPTPNQGRPTTDQHSSEGRQPPSASLPPNKRMVLVYFDDESVPEMFTLDKAISKKSEAASGSSTPQLSVLKANIEKRLAPRFINWGAITIEMNGLQVMCSHQDVFAFVCAETENQRQITLRGLRSSGGIWY